jgi:hypothetical protein
MPKHMWPTVCSTRLRLRRRTWISHPGRGGALGRSGQFSVVPRQRRGVVPSTCRRGENATNADRTPRPAALRQPCTAHELWRTSSVGDRSTARAVRPPPLPAAVKRTTPIDDWWEIWNRSRQRRLPPLAPVWRCGRGEPADNAPAP